VASKWIQDFGFHRFLKIFFQIAICWQMQLRDINYLAVLKKELKAAATRML
jgi:hypothetical protein